MLYGRQPFHHLWILCAQEKFSRSSDLLYNKHETAWLLLDIQAWQIIQDYMPEDQDKYFNKQINNKFAKYLNLKLIFNEFGEKEFIDLCQ